MKLSMWMIRDYLKRYHPEAFIENGRAELRGVRILAEGVRSAPSTLQLVRSGNYLDGTDNQVLCVHGHDMLRLATEDVDGVFNELMDCFDLYNDWEDRCTECIETGGSFQDLLEISRPFFRNMVLLSDSHMVIRNYVEPDPPAGAELTETQRKDLYLSHQILKNRMMPYGEMSEIRKKHRIQSAIGLRPQVEVEHSHDGSYSCAVMTLPLIYRRNTWGYLVEVCHFEEPDEYQKGILEQFGLFAQQWMEANASRESSHQYLSGIMERIVRDRRQEDLASLELYLQDKGWKGLSRKKLYLIRSTTDDPEVLSDLAYYLNNTEGGAAASVEDVVYYLADMENRGYEEAESYLRQNLKNMGCLAVCSYVFEDLCQLTAQISITETALNHLQETGIPDETSDRITDSSRFVLRHILRTARQASGELFCHPAVSRIREYDRQYGTELYRTLYWFLLCERSYGRTAQQLYLHRNTVQYRIGKLTELFDLDLEDAETRLHLLISMYDGGVRKKP